MRDIIKDNIYNLMAEFIIESNNKKFSIPDDSEIQHSMNIFRQYNPELFKEA